MSPDPLGWASFGTTTFLPCAYTFKISSYIPGHAAYGWKIKQVRTQCDAWEPWEPCKKITKQISKAVIWKKKTANQSKYM